MFSADEAMQCWGTWDELEYKFIVLSPEGKPPQYILVRAMLPIHYHDYCTMSRIFYGKLFFKNMNMSLCLLDWQTNIQKAYKPPKWFYQSTWIHNSSTMSTLKYSWKAGNQPYVSICSFPKWKWLLSNLISKLTLCNFS